MKHLLIILISSLCFAAAYGKGQPRPDLIPGLTPLNAYQLVEKGEDLAAEGDADSALLCFTMAAKKATEKGDKMKRNDGYDAVNAYLSQFHVYFQFYNDYATALKALNSADEIRDRMKLNASAIDFYYAVLYHTIGEQNNSDELKRKAFDLYKKAYQQSLNEDAIHLTHNAFSNIILSEYVTENLDTLERLHKEYVTLPSDSLSEEVRWFNTEMYDAMRVSKSNPSESLAILDRIISNPKLPKDRYRPYVLYTKAQIQSGNGDIPGAIASLRQIESEMEEESSQDIMMTIYHQLYKLFEKTGDKVTAAEYYLKYGDLKEKVASFTQMRNLHSVEMQRDIDRIQTDLDNERSRSQTLLYIIIGIGILICIGATVWILLYRANRKVKDSTGELFKKNVELLEAEKNLYEVNEEKKPEVEDKDLSRLQEIAEQVKTVLATSDEIWKEDFSASRMAELAGCGYTLLSQAINGPMGTSFHQLIADTRIKEICRRINAGNEYDNLTIDALASTVGIKSRTTFTSAFKRVTGMTPSVYVKLARQSRN